MTEDRLTKELRRLAKLLSAAAVSVEVIADEVASRPRAEPPSRQGEAARPALPPVEGEDAVEADEPDPTPWEALVEGALTLLREDPKRSWRPAELSRAARDSGVALASLQGVHFGLVARLRQVGAIEEDDAGLHASALLAGQPPEPAEVEPEPAAQAPKVRRELPWAQIVPAAMTLLKADPDRRWGQSELVRAVRDSGVPLDNLQGIHFGLTGRLAGLGAIEVDDEGRLRLGVLVGGRTAEPETARVTPSADAEPADEADSLAEEIDACELFLESMSPEQRSAQVAVWAGRARELQDTWKADPSVTPERRGALRRVFGRLSRITRDQQTGWIDALTPDWSMSWPVYIAWHSATLTGEPAALSDEELRALARATLRGLLLPARKHIPREVAALIIGRAATALDAEDDVLREVEARFGPARRAVPPLVRRPPPSSPLDVQLRPSAPAPSPIAPRPSVPRAPASAPTPAPEVVRNPVPEAVLALARGKRAVIVGGTGGREDHRKVLREELGLAELDWAASERGATGQFARTEERIKHGTYDLVLFLAGYTSHKSVPLLRSCKARAVPLVYLARGYSLAQVARAIEEQLVERKERALA